ncbi:LysE family transporter [Gilvibacter sp.]|uniref:LysE family transporter n=1 Tax=Gilvibacter sp. TaxID=2729997 RepID=UPI0025C1B51D|nr:LysE family transporter [Gilvibacter sp.]NQX76308.1 LysE family transporter [Gilvibacter sp.]
MFILYLVIGVLLAGIGGAFPGASNIAVISAAAKGRQRQGQQIAYGAGLGEISLAFLALSYSMFVADFLKMNPWIKVLFVGVFLIVGTLFLFKQQLPKRKKKSNESGSMSTRLLQGYLLAAINPPVLLFWLVAVALVNSNYVELSAMLDLSSLLFFFFGVFLGKVGILMIYGSTGKRLASKETKKRSKVCLHTLIGIALIGIAVVQALRLWVI